MPATIKVEIKVERDDYGVDETARFGTSMTVCTCTSPSCAFSDHAATESALTDMVKRAMAEAKRMG